jgi:hypothetical protein
MYDQTMQIVTGTVVKGRVVLNGATLPEGTVVTVFAEDSSRAVTLPRPLTTELEDALAEADREEGISGEEMLAQLSKYR